MLENLALDVFMPNDQINKYFKEDVSTFLNIINASNFYFMVFNLLYNIYIILASWSIYFVYCHL